LIDRQISVLNEALNKEEADDDDMDGEAETVMLKAFDKSKENLHA